MKTKTISIIIGILLIIGVGSLVYSNKQSKISPTETNTVDTSIKTNTPKSNTQTSTTTTTTPTGITLTTVANHNSSASCWSAINGNVYDLTSWIPNHPGGERAILYLCGIDGSAEYNGQHGGSGKTARILAGFKLGILSK